MLQFLRKNLDRHLVTLVLGLAFTFLIFSWFQTQQRLSKMESGTFEGLISLNYQEVSLLFGRDNSQDRPAIATGNGVVLFQYSDRLSSITVNGNSSNLWDTSHGYSIEVEKHTLYHTMQGAGWILTKEVVLGSDSHQIRINYYFLSPLRTSEVSLTLAHTQPTFLDLKTDSQGFKANVAGRRPIDLDQPQLKPAYLLSVSRDPNLSAAIRYKVYAGTEGQTGPAVIYSNFERPPVLANQRTLLASELINWDTLGKS
jgi:hypothetical protein